MLCYDNIYQYPQLLAIKCGFTADYSKEVTVLFCVQDYTDEAIWARESGTGEIHLQVGAAA